MSFFFPVRKCCPKCFVYINAFKHHYNPMKWIQLYPTLQTRTLKLKEK